MVTSTSQQQHQRGPMVAARRVHPEADRVPAAPFPRPGGGDRVRRAARVPRWEGRRPYRCPEPPTGGSCSRSMSVHGCAQMHRPVRIGCSATSTAAGRGRPSRSRAGLTPSWPHWNPAAPRGLRCWTRSGFGRSCWPISPSRSWADPLQGAASAQAAPAPRHSRPSAEARAGDRPERPVHLAEPTHTTITETTRYGTATASSWDRVHPRLTHRGCWLDHDVAPPVIEGTLIRLRVDHLPGDRDPKPMWPWPSATGITASDVYRCRQSFLRRFDLEHTFRLFQQTWAGPCRASALRRRRIGGPGWSPPLAPSSVSRAPWPRTCADPGKDQPGRAD